MAKLLILAVLGTAAIWAASSEPVELPNNALQCSANSLPEFGLSSDSTMWKDSADLKLNKKKRIFELYGSRKSNPSFVFAELKPRNIKQSDWLTSSIWKMNARFKIYIPTAISEVKANNTSLTPNEQKVAIVLADRNHFTGSADKAWQLASGNIRHGITATLSDGLQPSKMNLKMGTLPAVNVTQGPACSYTLAKNASYAISVAISNNKNGNVSQDWTLDFSIPGEGSPQVCRLFLQTGSTLSESSGEWALGVTGNWYNSACNKTAARPCSLTFTQFEVYDFNSTLSCDVQSYLTQSDLPPLAPNSTLTPTADDDDKSNSTNTKSVEKPDTPESPASNSTTAADNRTTTMTPAVVTCASVGSTSHGASAGLGAFLFFLGFFTCVILLVAGSYMNCVTVICRRDRFGFGEMRHSLLAQRSASAHAASASYTSDVPMERPYQASYTNPFAQTNEVL